MSYVQHREMLHPVTCIIKSIYYHKLSFIWTYIFIAFISISTQGGYLVNFTIFGETHQKVSIYFMHMNKYIMGLYRHDAPIENITTEIWNL